MRRIPCFFFAGLLTACAASPEGAQQPPESWRRAQSVSNCGSVDGKFAELGAPDPKNVRGMSDFAWPTTGSLSSMVRTGANGMSYGGVATVSIEIVDGHPRFKAFGSDGVEVPLEAHEWWCEGKSLTTRAVLGNVESQGVPKVRDESMLRLWRAHDGALIAEQTLESVQPKLFGSSARHRPLTRTYFSFPPATPSSSAARSDPE